MRTISFALVMLFMHALLPAQESESTAETAEEIDLSGLVDSIQKSATQTLGGRQFWSDVRFFQGWRIQENVFTDRCRLLDPDNRRHSSGTLEECEASLEKVREELDLPPMSGRAVILVHGLIRSSRSFDVMARRLESDDCVIVPFDYPSTRSSIPAAAWALSQVIESLEGIDTIDLVAHSMGGLVLRCYLRDFGDQRIHRAVLLGVPNHGARIADRLHNNPLYRVIYGPAGQQLTTEDEGLIADLPIPDCEFGVIAGGRGGLKGFNPLLHGDNDSTVTVRSARLQGAADFMLQPVIHSFLMSDRRCVQAVITFLEHGRFDLDREPQPIHQTQP